MKTLNFRITLLSDIILNQKSATEGANKTLDFIPGGTILGVAASKLYDTSDEKAANRSFVLFHSGKVRFSDANPAVRDTRTNKVPLSMYHPKFINASESCYVYHRINNLESLASFQLKQCRSGYYDFSSKEAKMAEVLKSFSLKSGHDKFERRSKDSQMFGYESLLQGNKFFFSVEVDDETLANDIKDALVGERHLGRSRSAQYGLVNIEEYNYNNPSCDNGNEGEVVVYADSRLIFLDDYGIPTFHPQPSCFGFDDEHAEILWNKSQIRTFSYSPWNFKRQCYDTDRCGFEKGSVFVIKTDEKRSGAEYVGKYRNEGFGHVLFNPLFLKSSEGNGKSDYHLNQALIEEKIIDNTKLQGTPLLDFLKRRIDEEQLEYEVYSNVNRFVKDHKREFSNEEFSSQWGNIRSMGMYMSDKKELINEIGNYLSHGVAKDKWLKFDRLNTLIDFLNKNTTNKTAQITVVNLASEMAKVFRKGGKR